jgi:hypothetical protein
MLNNSSNKTPNRQRPLAAKTLPRLSLDLHTMPQTDNSHFKKWLFLALLIFGLLVIAAIFIFWQ